MGIRWRLPCKSSTNNGWHRPRRTSLTPSSRSTILPRHHHTCRIPPELLESTNGIGVYFYPEEGIEIMNAFHAVISGFTKQGRDVTEEEAERLQGVMQSQAISPQFMRKLVQEHGDASLASVFLIPETTHKVYVGYLLRRYKGDYSEDTGFLS